MTYDRLSYWDTLPKDELERRVQIELKKRNLTFPETQLLSAAQERLRGWRGSSTRYRVQQEGTSMLDGNERETNGAGLQDMTTDEPAAAPPPPEEKEKKVKRTASRARKGKKRNSSGVVAKTKKETTRKTRERIDPDAKVTKASGAANPFREGSGAYKRTETVFKSSGQTAATIKKKAGILPQTLANLRKLGLVKIA